MELPKNFDLKPSNILKIAGIALVVIVVAAFAFRLLAPSFNSFFVKSGIDRLVGQSGMAPGANTAYYAKSEAGYGYDANDEALGLSIRNIAPVPMPPVDGVTTGDDAEEFEVTEYNAHIETRRLEDTCGSIATLKSREDVIFESANEYERSCSYRFKVKQVSVAEVLGIIEGLNPKELNESKYTIKNLVADYTSELEILERKMTSIEETLSNAVTAYDDITALATRTQDVESLATIINSKINIIERLTQERINVNAQLERIQRAKAQQLDRLEYTYFGVNVVENKFVDFQDLKDSWKNEIKSFVYDINTVIQEITIGLVALLFVAIQYIIYFFIVLVIAKYGWQLAKYIWKK